MPTRTGRKGRFRYLDAHGREIRDAAVLERIEKLAIPPAWKNVWIAARPRAKLQATGYDAAGRKQYIYHAEFRAERDRAKFDRLVRFGEQLPELRGAMAEHLDKEELDRDRVCAIALRLIDLGWFRVGTDRHTRASGTFGITTLRKRHVRVRGDRIRLEFVGKAKSQVRTSLVDDELAAAIRELIAVPGRGRLFRYERNGNGLCDLTSRTLNDYVKTHLGEEFSAKDFRTWGGTLLAAIAFAERPPDGQAAVTAVMRAVANRLGNTPAVCRRSYVAPAVVDAYLEGRTIADFRPRHLRRIRARQTGLDPEETALLALLNFK
ncbi:MAG: DNA topoisomerase IB [Acidobacteriota bacterium]|nr:DNA topoisomerase IB [Acidobacteriota bacterium]